jgi:signal peptidase
MFKKILKVIGDIFLVFVIVSAVIFTAMTLTSKKDGIPSLFGYSPFSILSGSMEPTLKTGDIVLCKKVDNNTELKENDIITFRTTIDGKKAIITHRINSITTLDDNSIIITTKGDNNDTSDANPLTREEVLAKYDNVRIPYLGYFITFISNKYVFFFLIILPLAILFLLELVDLIKQLVENAEERIKEEEEKEKEKKKQNNKKKK